MPNFKRPESVLIVVYAVDSRRVLMLRRNDDSAFWQSVSGSLEPDETALQAAEREVAEELGISIVRQNLTLVDCKKSIDFEIFPQFRHKYAANITHCHEHWFLLPLPNECKVRLTEHSDYRWFSPESAVKLTKSWNNALAIEEFLLKKITQKKR
ncbi:dihydroneopterin triphosphate diphosphatase [Chelonobacter oris]|uniref:dihydroneopterin triphosphate diphosphatase n=1 Tax=Chelonobacter oris TaxID=505317 RepID=UPI00244866F6|nr:dihydroneopterin triphosphate diphosphatase [Chelonobacter oris]MDH2999410.1 dihydroneopterin triphosphate diphosphatase [Chelonobacter oris]